MEIEDGEAARSIFSSESVPTRSVNKVVTAYEPDLSDFVYVPYEENLVQREEGYVKLDDRIASGTRKLTASTDSTYGMSSSRMAQSYKDKLYICYVTTETSGGSAIYFNMITSDDEGLTWKGPVIIGQRIGATEGTLDLKVHHDKIFFIMATGGAVSWELGVKVCHYLDWWNLSSIPKHLLDQNAPIQQTSLVEFQESMMVFWKRASAPRTYYQRYNNGTWSSTKDMEISVTCFSAVFSSMNGIDTVYLYFSSTTSKNLVQVKNTTNIGQTWSKAKNLKSLLGEVEHISTARGINKVHVSVSYDSVNKISYFYHTSSGSGDASDVATYTPNVQDADPREISISCVGKDIYIVYEETGGKVTLLTIRDGPYPVEKRSFGEGMAHSPALARDMTALCFMNGTKLEIRTLKEAERGRMFLYPVSPVALDSWDDIALCAGGMTNDSHISFRILDWRDGTQLFPLVGEMDLRALDPGWINDDYYTAKTDLQGNWSSGDDLVPSLIIEVLFQRAQGEDPWLTGVCLNYTNSFPYREEFREDLHISASMNCGPTPVGLRMDEGADDAWAIIGPIEFEGGRPRHLSLVGSFLGGENTISAEILDDQWETVPGFGMGISSLVTQEDVQTFLKWEGKNIYDIPSTLDTIYVKVRMEKKISTEPAVKWLEFGGSTEPMITDQVIDRNWIHRGDSVSVHITADDMEDPPEDLSVELEYMSPGSDIWETGMISQGMWDGGAWSFDIFTDMETPKGKYHFRARVKDDVDMVSEWKELDLTLEVRNNLPDAPLIMVRPAAAKVGEEIEVYLLREGKDLEIPAEELTYNMTVSRDGVEHVTHDNISSPNMVLDELPLEKHQNWTVSVGTWDGENLSEPLITWFTVENTGPVPTQHMPSSLELEEDEQLLVQDVDRWFFDADNDDVELSFSSTPQVDVSIEDGDVLLTPEKDYNGEGYLIVDYRDDEFSQSANISLSIISINDPPVHAEVPNLEVRQGKWIYVDIGAHDPSDGESVSVTSNILDIIPGLEPGTNLFQYPNGSFRLKTDNGMVGSHNITLTIMDAESSLLMYVELKIIDVNDRPSIISAECRGSRTVFRSGEEITLVAEAVDIDEPWGDGLTYEWSSNIEGSLGSGSEFRTTLQQGIHTISLEVLDKRGGYNSTSFDIMVLEGEEEQGKVMRTSTLYLITGIAAFLIGLIICILLIWWSLMRRKKEKEEETEETKEKEGPKPSLGPGTAEQLGPGPQKGPSQERQLPPAEIGSEKTPPDQGDVPVAQGEVSASSQHIGAPGEVTTPTVPEGGSPAGTERAPGEVPLPRQEGTGQPVEGTDRESNTETSNGQLVADKVQVGHNEQGTEMYDPSNSESHNPSLREEDPGEKEANI